MEISDARWPSERDSPVVRAVPGYQAVVDLLRRELVLGRIRPGDKLPPERQLAAELGVARETLRQALRVLEGSGQIAVARGTRGGAVVQESILDPQLIRADLVPRVDDILALTEFRRIVDSGAARLAAQRRDDDDISSMDAAQQEMSRSNSLHGARLADTAFHLAVAAASRNAELARAVEDARVKMFGPVDILSFSFDLESSHSAHAQVLDAIRARDAEAAGAAMERHLETSREEFRRLLNAQSPGNG